MIGDSDETTIRHIIKHIQAVDPEFQLKVLLHHSFDEIGTRRVAPTAVNLIDFIHLKPVEEPIDKLFVPFQLRHHISDVIIVQDIRMDIVFFTHVCVVLFFFCHCLDFSV